MHSPNRVAVSQLQWPIHTEDIRRAPWGALAPGVHLFPHQKLHRRYHIGPVSRHDGDTCRAVIERIPGDTPLNVTVSLDATLRDVVSFLLLSSTSAFVYGDGTLEEDADELAMRVEVVGVREQPGEVRSVVDARDFLFQQRGSTARHGCLNPSFLRSDARNIGELLTMAEQRFASIESHTPPLLRFRVHSSACRTESRRRVALEASEAAERDDMIRKFFQAQRLWIRVVPHEADVTAWHEMKCSTTAEGVSEAVLLGTMCCAVLQAESPMLDSGDAQAQWESETLSTAFLSTVESALSSLKFPHRSSNDEVESRLVEIPLFDMSPSRLLSSMPWWPTLKHAMQAFAMDSRLLQQESASLLTQLFVSHRGATEVLDGSGTTLRAALVGKRVADVDIAVDGGAALSLLADVVVLSVSVMPLITRHRVRLRTFAEASESATVTDASDADAAAFPSAAGAPSAPCPVTLRYRVAAIRAVWEAESCFRMWLQARLRFSPSAWLRHSSSGGTIKSAARHLHVPSVVGDYLKSMGFECSASGETRPPEQHHVEPMLPYDDSPSSSSVLLPWQTAVHREAEAIADSLASDALAPSTPAIEHVQVSAQFICSLDAVGLLSSTRYPGMDRSDRLMIVCREVHQRHMLFHRTR